MGSFGYQGALTQRLAWSATRVDYQKAIMVGPRGKRELEDGEDSLGSIAVGWRIHLQHLDGRDRSGLGSWSSLMFTRLAAFESCLLPS